MKINFMTIRTELDRYGSPIYKNIMIDIVSYYSEEDFLLKNIESDFTINMKDRFISKKDYLLKNCVDGALNIVYDEGNLNILREVLGESFSNYKFYVMVDIFAWCLNNKKLELKDISDLNELNQINKASYDLKFSQNIYSKVYMYFKEYEKSLDSITTNDTPEHILIDLNADNVPVNFLNKVEFKEEDKVYIFEGNIGESGYYRDGKIIDSKEMKTFLKIAKYIEVKEKVSKDFFTNILLHILQNKDIKRYTIISNIRETDGIVNNLRTYLDNEYEIYGLYSDYAGAISEKDLDCILHRHSNPISLLDELKESLGESYALIIFRASLYDFYRILYTNKRQEDNESNNKTKDEKYEEDIIDIFQDITVFDDDGDDI